MGSWVVLDAVALAWFAGLLLYVARHRPPSPMWPSLPLALATCLVWVIGDFGTRADPERLELWMTVEYTGIIWIPPLLWLIGLRFAESCGSPFPWSRRAWTYAPLGFAGLMWLGMATNRWHGAFLTPVPGARSDFQALWWINGFGTYLQGWAILAVYLALRLRQRSWVVRRKVAIMIAATAALLLINSWYVFAPRPTPLDLGLLSLILGSGLLTLGIYRTGLFNPMPVAIPEVLLDDPTAVVLVDPAGYAFFTNTAGKDILSDAGWAEPDNVYGFLGRALRWPDGHARVTRAALEQELEEPDGPDARRLYLLPGRQDHFVHVERIPIRTKRGYELGSCLRLRDVTESVLAQRRERKNEERMRETQKLESLGVLAGGIAHDFNNLLVPILANANLLREEASSPRERDALEQIEDAARHAAELVDQLLAYAGRGSRTTEHVDLSALVRRMTDLLGTAASGLVLIEYELAEDLPAVEGDPSQLEQVAMNLVTNAAEALGDGRGVIHIATRTRWVAEADLVANRAGGSPAPGPYVVLEVRDSGCGMDGEMLARMFDPFFTTKRMGRGLGLAALRGIVRAHGGLLQVESEIGRGSSLRVLLPAASAGPTRALEEPRPPSRWRSDGVILLVDDEEPVRRALGRMLRRLGFEPIEARNGPDALELFTRRAREIRAVILDFAMPGMSGAAVLAKLRSMRADVPVVVASGYSEADLSQATPRDRLTSFLQKPFSADTLQETLRAMLGE